MTDETVLVTGASGFVGRATCAYLLQKNYRVRALVRKTSRWTIPDHANLEVSVGDMKDAASLERATVGVRWVAHLAAAKSDESHSRLTNVDGAKHLVSACRKNGVEFIINISTQSTKVQGKGIYGMTKEAADEVFHASGVPVTTLRSSLVYGNRDEGLFSSLIKFSRLPLVPVIGPGTAPHWPIHVEDLARAIEMASRKPVTRGQIYEVGGPESTSLDELIRECIQRQGLRRRIVHIPMRLGLLVARVLSVFPHPPFTRSNVLGGNVAVSMDVERFFHDFDFTPRRFKQGLDDLFHSTPPDMASTDSTREATLLLSYVMSDSGVCWKPASDVQERYVQAIQAQVPAMAHQLDPFVYRHPVLLGGLDAVSRLFYPHSMLQQKLIVAAALTEYHPASASWLLPQDRSLTSLLREFARLALRLACKETTGLLILLFPRFVHRNVRPL